MGDYKRRLTSTHPQDKCIDPETGEPIDIVVLYKGRSIARVKRINEGRERGKCTGHMFWYPPPQQPIEALSMKEAEMIIAQIHDRVKGGIEQYYHPED